MLAARHVAEYVFEWGNLHEHSQQGWKVLNALVKSFIFWITPHEDGLKKSRLKPIARWLQRRAIWLCGYNEASIQEFLRRLEEEEDEEMQLQDLGEGDNDNNILDHLDKILGEPMEEIFAGTF